MPPPAPRPASKRIADAVEQTAAEGEKCSRALEPAVKRARRTTFGSVHILTHETQLDGSKLPSDGRAPIGLGRLAGVELRNVVSFDEERKQKRVESVEGRNVYPRPVRTIPRGERQQNLTQLHSIDSISEVEQEIRTIKQQRFESAFCADNGLGADCDLERVSDGGSKAPWIEDISLVPDKARDSPPVGLTELFA